MATPKIGTALFGIKRPEFRFSPDKNKRMSDTKENYGITYCGYAFTVREMHEEIRARREEAKRVREMGEAALNLDALLTRDFRRVVAISDYYDLVWKPSQVGLAR